MVVHPGVYVSLVSLTHRIVTEKKLASEMRAIMQDLGSQQYRNAIQALDDATMSSSPRHELTNAVNHLQDAISTSEAAYWKANYSFADRFMDGLFRDGIPVSEDPRHPRYAIGKTISQSWAMIATIYYCLNQRELARKYAAPLRTTLLAGYPSIYNVAATYDATGFADEIRRGPLSVVLDAITETNKFLATIGVKKIDDTITVRIHGDSGVCAHYANSVSDLKRQYSAKKYADHDHRPKIERLHSGPSYNAGDSVFWSPKS